jgi:hypothetical protein
MMDLTSLKTLTTEQYDRARRKALERVQKRIGDKPKRVDFYRDLGSIFTLLDGLMFAVFIPAFIVSSIHILQHMGALANASYPTIATYRAGTVIGQDFYATVHQWALIPLAEASMLLFLVMFAMTKREDWRKWVFLVLATVATAFVVIVNAGAGLGLESLLAPVFTIGVGLHLEGLIVRQLERRSDVNTRYLAALAMWEAASQDATKHPNYVPILKQEVGAPLNNLSSNKAFVDAPVSLKHAAVIREMERDTWAYQGGDDMKNLSYSLPIRPNGSHPESEGEAAPKHPLEELSSITRVNDDGESV